MRDLNYQLKQHCHRNHDGSYATQAKRLHRLMHITNHPEIEKATNTKFYFATPHHSWERGTNENTNGLIRQYIPKGSSMKDLTQAQCDRITKKLNTRPRKRHGFKTPEEILYG